VEEFYRKRRLYQLSASAEAAEQALNVFDEYLHRPGELQTTALHDILELLAPVRMLLRQIAAAGARLRYHGDFDGKGLEIASTIFTHFGAEPWRMGVDDYLQAPKGRTLKLPPTVTPWCPDLAVAMQTERRIVHEEAIADSPTTATHWRQKNSWSGKRDSNSRPQPWQDYELTSLSL